jgi:hypothetical protein
MKEKFYKQALRRISFMGCVPMLEDDRLEHFIVSGRPITNTHRLRSAPTWAW